MARSPDDLPEGTDSIIDEGFDAAARSDTDFELAGDAPSDTAFEPAFASSAYGDTLGAAETGSKREQIKQKFAETTADLKGQATEKARAYAVEGKDRATGALDNLARMVSEAADSVDQQIGPQYGDYARKAADLVSGLSSQLQAKDVDALVADAGDFVRKSPAIAIGAAAALGFVLVRLVKSGVDGGATGMPTAYDADASGDIKA